MVTPSNPAPNAQPSTSTPTSTSTPPSKLAKGGIVIAGIPFNVGSPFFTRSFIGHGSLVLFGVASKVDPKSSYIEAWTIMVSTGPYSTGQLHMFAQGSYRVEDVVPLDIAIPFGPLPGCGHSSQYSYTNDGGRTIICLLCEHKRMETPA